ncbi:MAG: hypothetical protein ACO4AI_07400 [Prochlorothrix sp.]
MVDGRKILPWARQPRSHQPFGDACVGHLLNILDELGNPDRKADLDFYEREAGFGYNRP